MSATLLPDYVGGSIVNLMQSIATACGARQRLYAQQSLLSAAQLSRARHIVLLVVDGMGLRTLDKHPASPNLQRHLLGSMTSVFPSTTASAITTFMSGLAPAQHGLTGWHMHMDEVDQTLAILPLTPRQGPAKLPPAELPARLFEHPSLFSGLDREGWVVAPQSIAASPFNSWHARGAQTLAYTSLPGLFDCLADLLQDNAEARYIYAYYPELDTLSHHYGTDSRQARQVLADFDQQLGGIWPQSGQRA
jgi:predicted AlkP superfamily pyrophosphatase or phosphodiesterase